MIDDVLFVVDGSLPCRETAALAHSLLPKTVRICVLQVVPQLPYAWIAWPAFPDATQDLAKAWAYVSEVGDDLAARGWKVSVKVHFSTLSAAEIDREILALAETLRPDLICLALESGRVAAGVVRKALMPVLVARPPSPDDAAGGLRKQKEAQPEPALVPHTLLLNPAAALLFRHAGIL